METCSKEEFDSITKNPNPTINPNWESYSKYASQIGFMKDILEKCHFSHMKKHGAPTLYLVKIHTP